MSVCLMVRPVSSGASIAAVLGCRQTVTMRWVRRMNISPVRRLRVPEEIVDQIRGLIASGDLRPGDQLPSERELAEQFQVSRASIENYGEAGAARYFCST